MVNLQSFEKHKIKTSQQIILYLPYKLLKTVRIYFFFILGYISIFCHILSKMLNNVKTVEFKPRFKPHSDIWFVNNVISEFNKESKNATLYRMFRFKYKNWNSLYKLKYFKLQFFIHKNKKYKFALKLTIRIISNNAF